MDVPQKQLLDPNDGVALRTYYEALRAQLTNDRARYEAKWQQLEAFFAPGTARWDYTQVDDGERHDQAIINETGLLAWRVLKAGMLTGMSSQTRQWYKLGDEDPAIDALAEVRQWCETVEERSRAVFLKSNTYQTLLTCYGEEGLYGTGAFLVLEDEKTVIRCHPYPIGSYYLGTDDTLRVDLCIRVLSMTVRQIVERFGFTACSEAVQALYVSNAGGSKEQRYPIVHVIHKGSYFGRDGMKPPMPWMSIWYELGPFNTKAGILRKSGFLENPLVCGRWTVVGEDTWGRGAGDDCLGSVMSLQAWEERTAQACEKQIDPPLVASSEVDPLKLGTLPGDIIFADTKDVSNALKPAYQFEFRLEGAISQIQRIEARINDAMYRSLFQMFSESDRRDITAEEIRARSAEKMQVLGPVVERNVEEVLAPLVMRTISIMARRGMLPPMPASMKGRPIKLQFESILALAQKAGGINSLTQLMAFVGNEVAVNQGILDVVDLDQATREFAELADVPSKILRAPEQIAQIRADRQRQQAMAQAADNAQKLAAAGANMANTPLNTGSLLDRALPALAGGGE